MPEVTCEQVRSYHLLGDRSPFAQSCRPQYVGEAVPDDDEPYVRVLSEPLDVGKLVAAHISDCVPCSQFCATFNPRR